MAVRLSALRAGRPLPPGRFLVLICQRLNRPQNHSAAGRIRSIEKSNDITRNRTRDLPACSIVPQTTTLPIAPWLSPSLTHVAEPFLRSCHLCSYSRTSQHFMEPEGSLPCSQEPSTGPYPEPDHSNPYRPILSKIDCLHTIIKYNRKLG
jgi:hypothetical protein